MMPHLVASLLIALVTSTAFATEPRDWPTHRGDRARSGKTDEAIDATRLVPGWRHVAATPPDPAWPGPARWDAFAALAGLRSMRNYDPVFHAIAVGDAVYYGSSSENCVRRLDAATGDVVWTHAAGAPVRIAPTFHDGRLYFGADDGYATCLDAKTGEVEWQFSPTVGTRRVLNDGRVISRWPVRTGVLVDRGIAFFGASLLPWKQSYLCAVDARTGRPSGGPGRFVREHSAGLTLEGPLLLARDRVIVPQGRVAPLLFSRKNGDALGALEGGGGCFVLLTEDDQVLHGPGPKEGWVTASDGGSRAKVASYARGNAVVVDGKTAFLLSDRALTALDRGTGAILWSVGTTTKDALVLAGDVLIAGGRDLVEARHVEDGRRLWRGEVNGRAHGLAVARGRLLVSTDVGELSAFEVGDTPAAPAEGAVAGHDVVPVAPIETVRDRALLDRWVFQENGLVRRPVAPNDPREVAAIANHATGKRAGDARVVGSLSFVRAGAHQAVALDGRTNDFPLAETLKAAKLPSRALTVTAWVRIDRPIEWGGIISAMQDNGDYEKGWVLGYRQDRFGFALAGEKGPGHLSWITSPTSYERRGWHHVAGTYDGKRMKLFVDGEVAREGDEQRGGIDYPKTAAYQAGAYRDDDEHFRMTGALHELRVYSRALTAKEIAAQFAEKAQRFPEPLPAPPVRKTGALASGPEIRFLDATTARIAWETKEPCLTRFELDLPAGGTRMIEELPSRRTDHEVVVDGLARRTLHTFRVDAAGGRMSADFECDTHFAYDWAPDGITAAIGLGELQEAASRVVRVTAKTIEELPRRFANRLVVSVGAGAEAKDLLAAGVLELVRPYGGEARFPASVVPSRLPAWVDGAFTRSVDGDEVVFTRGAPVGAVDWTHMYGSADNSGFAGEALGGARGVDDLELQWIGRPGPRHQSDRQNRKPAPLAAAGRLFVQGLHRVIALDAWNGSLLWAWELPELARFNVPRSSSNWCVDAASVWLAVKENAWRLDAATGDRTAKFPVVTDGLSGGSYEWGLVARVDDALLGSAVRRGAQFEEFWGKTRWFDGKDGESAAKVVSDNLFALDPEDGSTRWTYAPDARIINPTITVADGRVFFVETRDAASRAHQGGRLSTTTMWDDLHLVALDLESGQVAWEREAKPMPGVTAFYLAHSDGRLLLQSSAQGSFALYAMDAADGESLWRKKFAWEVDHHGKHLSHVAAVGGEVYVRPLVFDLATGKELDRPFPGGHQCGTYVASQDALFLRAGNLCVWDRATGESSRWERLRPDCWISTIPANGLLLSPEGGGGCSCGSWIESSMAFAPRERRQGG